MGFPLPSARRWILVESPPRLRPDASESSPAPAAASASKAPPFSSQYLLQRRADAPEPRSRPRDGVPSRSLPERPPGVGAPQAPVPTRPLSPSGRSGLPRCARGRTRVEGRARALRCDRSRGWRSRRCDGPWRGALFWAFEAATEDESAPTACRSRCFVPYPESNNLRKQTLEAASAPTN